MNYRKCIFFCLICLSFCNCRYDRIEYEPISIIIDSLKTVKAEINYFTPLKSGYLNKQYRSPSSIKIKNNVIFTAVTSSLKLSDTAYSNIVGIKSYDDGNTWSKPVIIQKNIAKINVFSPSLLKISEEHILFFFGAKESTSWIDIYFKESYDGGETWGRTKLVNTKNTGYHIINNGRVIYKNNRIWIPVALPKGDIYKNYDSQSVFCYYSDDLGKSWSKTKTLKKSYPLMEPCLTVLSNNELLLNIRTKNGKILFARSFDNGDSWNFEYSNINSPAAPQTIIQKNKTDTLFMAWNNSIYNSKSIGNGKRTPLSIAYSPDKGYSWNYIMDIEDSLDFDFSYPSIFQDNNNFYISYNKISNVSKGSSIKLAKFNIYN